MYVACLGPWMGIDYHTQLAGSAARGDLVRPARPPRTVIHQQHSERLRCE